MTSTTSRLSFVSRALYTCPNPFADLGAVTSWGPSRVAGSEAHLGSIACQFNRTVIGASASSPTGTFIKKCVPSGLTP